MNILYDNDFGGDIDNLGGVMVLSAYERLGLCNVLGFGVVWNQNTDCGAADAALRTRGVDWSAKIAAYPGPAVASTFSTNLYNNFTRTLGLAGTVQGYVNFFRTVLAARTSRDVIWPIGGPFTAADALLQSPADGISSLTGSQLIAASVKYVVGIAGRYPPDPNSGVTSEYNLAADPVTAAHFAANCPVPIYWHGTNTGQSIFNGTTLTTVFGPTDAVRAAYNDSTHTNGRAAWDSLGVLTAVEGFGDFTMTRGTNSINTSNGVNTFTASSTGPHYYLTKTRTDSEYATRLNALINAATSGTAVTSWPGTAVVGLSVS